MDMTSKITGEWKSYCAHRVASAHAAEKSSVSIHLATAKQVIELGPVFVFNFGKGYDQPAQGVRWLKTRSIPAAVRELCLAFPGVEEFESHGSPNYRARSGPARARYSPCGR